MVLANLLSHWLESLDYEYHITSDCTLHQSTRSSCTACIDSCPVDAITLEDGKPVIDTSSCIDCGNCVASCPVQAVEGFMPKRKIQDQSLIIDESQAPALKELLVYYKQGIVTIVNEKGTISPEWQKAIENANQTLAGLGEESFQIKHEPLDPPKDKVMSRRELFFGWKKDIKKVGQEMTPAKWRFNHESLDLSKHYPDHQFIDISLDTSKCTLCNACEMLCKKKCITIEENHFSISASQCTNCSLCQDICPEQAITLTEMIAPATTVKHEIYKKDCADCGMTFSSVSEEHDLCLICKNKDSFAGHHLFA